MALKRCTTCNGAGTKETLVEIRKTGPIEGSYERRKVRCPGECRGEGWIHVADKR